MHRSHGSGETDHRGSKPSSTLWLGGAILLLGLGCGRSAPAEGGGPPSRTVQEVPRPAEGPVDRAPAFVPRFTREGSMLLPAGEIWRSWPYVGTPLTPNALNDGEAPFPEFHSVYIDPVSWDHWRRTGTFREGTILAKELVTVHDVDALPDGSTRQVSGRGYFMGEFAGFEIAYKSAARYPDEPGHWAYFSFGHHAPPYGSAATKMPVADCNACHGASAAEDFVFTQFYPVLRAAKAGD